MQEDIGRKMDMLTRVDELLSAVPEFAPLTGSTARANLSAVIAGLRAHAAAQNQSDRESRAGTQAQRAALRVLRRRMRTVAAAARYALRDPTLFMELGMPKGRPTPQALLAAADGMAAAARVHHDALAASGLTSDFIDGVVAAADAVRNAGASRGDRVLYRMGATKSMRTLSSDARHIVTMLDGLVVPLIPPDDPGGLLVRWNAARRIGRRPGGAAPPLPVTASDTPVAEVTSRAA